MVRFMYLLLLSGATAAEPQWHIPTAQPRPSPVYHPTTLPISNPNTFPISTSQSRLGVPANDPSSWVNLADYPLEAIANREEGRTAVALAVNSKGLVTQCVVTVSSGSPLLDATTCDKLSERARFEPARNARGQLATAVYASAVRWRLPDVMNFPRQSSTPN